MNTKRKPEVVAITGASAGLGRATAREFGRRGACVGLIARGLDGLQAAAREIESYGGRALVIPCDVANSDAVEEAAASIEREFGPLDIWINNAMVSVFSPVAQMMPDEYRRVMEVTYLGTVHGTLAALRRMLPRNNGIIVQVGSALAYRSIPLQSAYCAAKHAIQGFTQSLRTELIHDGSRVCVTMVQMPALNTPQFSWVRSRLPNEPQPVPPIYQPEDGARAIVWAVEHRPREVEVGLLTSLILKANSVVPGVGDWYLGLSGYDSQMTDQPLPAGRADNLWNPLPGDHGAHGQFDARAHHLLFPPRRISAFDKYLAAGLIAGFAAICIGLFRRKATPE